MEDRVSPLHEFFRTTLHWSLSDRLGLDDRPVETYLADMLVRLVGVDGLYALRDDAGRPVDDVAEMLAYGDVRLKADSFGKEREVHRHVGDFLLFWSGLFPEHLGKVKGLWIDPIEQGRASYAIAASFDHAPYDREAPTLRKLSRSFETYRDALHLLRRRFGAIG